MLSGRVRQVDELTSYL